MENEEKNLTEKPDANGIVLGESHRQEPAKYKSNCCGWLV